MRNRSASRRCSVCWAVACVSILATASSCGDDGSGGELVSSTVTADTAGGDGTSGINDTVADAIATTDTAQPDTAQPDTAQPDTAAPDTAQPDTAQPDTALPDTAAPDTAQSDTSKADAAPSCPGDPGCTCKSNAECFNGLCVDTPDARVCGTICTDDAGCAATEMCGELSPGKKACVTRLGWQCNPCKTTAECIHPGTTDSQCVIATGPGNPAFCALACTGNADCSAGYTCKDAAAVDKPGEPIKRCVPDAPCACNQHALTFKLSGLCSNADGCSGKATCGAGGLSKCDAPAATAELCDAKDNDCDGTTDEADEACDDANECSTDTCQGGVKCGHLPVEAACTADGDVCTADACVSGVCKAGGPKDCDDGNGCTVDTCDAKTGDCKNAPMADGATCVDASACTVDDACTAGACKGKPRDCNDANPCTGDGCEPQSGCVHSPISAACDDGDPCSKADSCADGKCAAGAALDCDDKNTCTTDACDSSTGKCTHAPHTGSCDDGNVCTEADACKQGTCSGTGKDCGDGNACTTNSCDPLTGCTFALNSAPCDDGSKCTTFDKCAKGKCAGVAVDAADCDDNNACTTDACDLAVGCTSVGNDKDCDDGNSCTVGDQCAAGTCAAGKNNVCACQNDGDCAKDNPKNRCQGTLYCDKSGASFKCVINPTSIVKCDVGGDTVCSATSCDPVAAKCVAVSAKDGKACDADGTLCTVGDACAAGKCSPGDALDCDDKNVCTADSCNATKGCSNIPNTAACDADGSKCTVNDVCNNGTCIAGAKKTCQDGDACTTDKCDAGSGACSNPIIVGCGGNCATDGHCDDKELCTTDKCVAGKCQNSAFTGKCDDSNPCTEGDACIKGKCDGLAKDCDDGNPCTTEGCLPASGCTVVVNNGACDDGDGCTVSDKCADGKCGSGAAKKCDDGDKCTADSCNPGDGACKFTGIPGCGSFCETVADCDDKNPCTDEQCVTGKCSSSLNTKACDDANKCTKGDKCANAVCTGAKTDCDDKNFCTVDSCDASTGSCINKPGNKGDKCDDNSKCTAADVCADSGGTLTCVGVAKSCDDGNACTDDSCDATTGNCTKKNNTAGCEDGNKCTVGDTCTAGACKTGAGLVVDTLAGSTDGYADGKGTAAKLSINYGLTAAADGAIYVADTNNHRIRRVATDGTTTTFAGEGKAGLLNGTGTKAWFNRPFDIDADPAGKLVVADRDNHTIRSITAKAEVTTLAGTGAQGYTEGAADKARFYHPWGVAVAGQGVVYVADRTNHRVRKIAAGTVTTLAGSSYGFADGPGAQAQFRYPIGIDVDASGNVIVADENNHRIRRVTPAGNVTTLAGSGTAGFTDGGAATARFNRPWGVLVDGQGRLFVADRYNHRVREIGGGVVSTWVGTGAQGTADGLASAAQLRFPTGLTADASGYVYIADANNFRVRRARDSTAPCSIAGVCYVDGAPNPKVPCEACAAAASTAKWSAGKDGKTCDDGQLCTAADACKSGACAGAAILCDDKDKCTTDSCDKTTGGCVFAPIVGCGGNCAKTADCDDKNGCTDNACTSGKCAFTANSAACDDGDKCTWGDVCKDGKCESGDRTEVLTIAGSDTAGYKDGAVKDAQFRYPRSLGIDGKGNIFTTSAHNHVIRKITAAGTVSTYAGSGVAGIADGPGKVAQFNGPSDVEVGSDGTLYVADLSNHRVRMVATDQTVTTLAGSGAGLVDGAVNTARLRNPYGVAVTPGGVVYVGDYGNHAIRKIADGQVTTFAGGNGNGYADGPGLAAKFSYPIGVAVGPTGNIFVADYNNSRIRKISPDGAVTTLAGAGIHGYQDGDGKTARFNRPWGIDVDSKGDVYVADRYNHRLRRITPSGLVFHFAGTSPGAIDGDAATTARLYEPWGIAIDAAGYVFTTDYQRHRVRRTKATKDHCAVGGVCYSAGLKDPAAPCNECDAAKSTTAFSAIADGQACADGAFCSTADTCTSGKCAGAARDCDDKIACTKDFCDTRTGSCVNEVIVGCGGFCTQDSHCDDKNLCTTDACDSKTQKCTNTNNSAPCDDKNDCTAEDTCAGGKCAPGTATWVRLIAGTGAASQPPLNGDTDKSTFRYPEGLDFDAAGNLYVADMDNDVIRKIDTSGKVSTFSGSTRGFLDDIAGKARFDRPSDVSVSPAGKIYVADRVNHRIRLLDATGKASTFAGATAGYLDGKGVNARFNNPYGIAATAGDVVYVADYSNHRIRRIEADGTVSTIAGGGSGYVNDIGLKARFNGPIAVAVDLTGNLLVADYSNHRVRRIAIKDLAVTSLAGNGKATFADGKGEAAQFNYPRRVAVGPRGYVYVADYNNHRIRKIAADGTTTTLSGSGAAGDVLGNAQGARHQNPRGVTVAPTGEVFISDSSRHKIKAIRETAMPCAIGGVCYVNGITKADEPCNSCDASKSGSSWTAAADTSACSDGNLCTTGDTCASGKCAGTPTTCNDSDACTADSCDASTGKCANKSIIGCNGYCETDAQCNDGNACTTGEACVNKQCTTGNSATISTVAGSSAGYLDEQDLKAKFDQPYDVAVDAAGVLYVADFNNNRIRKIATDGKVTTLTGDGTQGLKSGKGTAAWHNRPAGIVTDGTGNLFVTNRYSYAVQKIDKDLNVTTFAGNGAAGDTDGKGTAARFNQPIGLAIHKATKELYVAGYNSFRVRKIATDGTVTTLAGSTNGYADGKGSAAKFLRPIGLDVDSAGNVFVATYSGHRIRKITPDGTTTTLAGNGSAGNSDGDAATSSFNRPWGVAVDSGGRVFVADTANRRIRRIFGGIVQTIAGTSAGSDDGPTPGSGRLSYPYGMTMDPTGTMWVVDNNTARIRKLVVNASACHIGGVCYMDGVVNPAKTCEKCSGSSKPKAWDTSGCP